MCAFRSSFYNLLFVSLQPDARKPPRIAFGGGPRQEWHHERGRGREGDRAGARRSGGGPREPGPQYARPHGLRRRQRDEWRDGRHGRRHGEPRGHSRPVHHGRERPVFLARRSRLLEHGHEHAHGLSVHPARAAASELPRQSGKWLGSFWSRCEGTTFLPVTNPALNGSFSSRKLVMRLLYSLN